MREATRVHITDFLSGLPAKFLGEEPAAVAAETIFEWMVTQLVVGDSVAWNGRTICWAQRPDSSRN
jgi:hypothetical protein